MAIVSFFLAVVVLSASVYNPVSAIWEYQAAISGWIENTDRAYIENALTNNLPPEDTYSIVWRSRRVQDRRTTVTPTPMINAESERLWRWDRQLPENVFRTGFVPRVDLGTVLGQGFSNPAVNLRRYVATNIASVYVSTTRRNWTPRNRRRTFRYDIFAPGGINVNPTLQTHRFSNQEEIAFVGGILTNYIYGAVEYNENGRQVMYHRNLLYSGSDTARVTRLLTRCRTPITTYPQISSPVQPYACSADCAGPSAPVRRTKRATNDELMREPGYLSDAVSSCSFWYKVQITSLAFDQHGEYANIEPYGRIEIYTTDIYQKSLTYTSIWEESRELAKSVPQDMNLTSFAKCVVVISALKKEPIELCFIGYVSESDNYGDDDIATFAKPNCTSIYPINRPSSSYSIIQKGADGHVKINFKVEPCDPESCVQSSMRKWHGELSGNC